MTHFSSLIDSHATSQTIALFENLHRLSGEHVLFGHQHATEYGHGWSGDQDRSDIKSVVGSHPAVIGVELNGLSGYSREQVKQNTDALRKTIVETYNRGGVTTLCWHFNNPVSETGFYAYDPNFVPAVPHLVPGGSHHELYQEALANIANLAKSVFGKDGTLAPLIFRPFHEFDGTWFWWGKPYCTAEDFVALWRFTVSYLRDTLDVHNFIYAFSPDCLFQTEAEYLERYPGDAWVDLLGIDDYADFGREGKYDLEAGIRKLRIVSDYAAHAGKLAAFTETGLESITEAQWWTETLLRTLKADGVRLCYVLVWRNDVHSPTHYYAPFPGHPSVPDFLTFAADPHVLLENDLPPLYRRTHAPVDSEAMPEAKALLQLLYRLSGEFTLTGQHNFPNRQRYSTDLSTTQMGKTPAIYGTDWGFAAPSDKDSAFVRPQIVQELIAQWQNGSIVTLCWHAVPPIENEPVTFSEGVQSRLTETQFDALLTPGTEIHTRWCAQVDNIAHFLRQLQEARVPILWRPLHEINGDWFWWNGYRGGPSEGTKQLYRLLYDRLVNVHQLHNLLWVWNPDRPSRADRQFADYFPGQEFIDILALDCYGSFEQSYYDDLIALSDGKPLAIGETYHPPALETYQMQPGWVFWMRWAVDTPEDSGQPPIDDQEDREMLRTVTGSSRFLSLQDAAYRTVLNSVRAAAGLPPVEAADRLP